MSFQFHYNHFYICESNIIIITSDKLIIYRFVVDREIDEELNQIKFGRAILQKNGEWFITLKTDLQSHINAFCPQVYGSSYDVFI